MDDDSLNENPPNNNRPEKRLYRKSPGRQYGYDFDPLHSQSSSYDENRGKPPNTGKLISDFVEQNRSPIRSLDVPLVRRAPYLYEDDPLRQELAQQIDEEPIIRRSSRYIQEAEEDLDYEEVPSNIPPRASRSVRYEAQAVDRHGTLPSELEPTLKTPEADGSPIPLLNHYRRKVLQQANQSFILALVAAVIGLIFYIAAVSFLLFQKPTSISFISLISGSLVEVIAGINFYLYGHTSRQLASFHMFLDRSCRFEASIGACEKITDKELRDQTHSKLILAYMEMSETFKDVLRNGNTKGN